MRCTSRERKKKPPHFTAESPASLFTARKLRAPENGPDVDQGLPENGGYLSVIIERYVATRSAQRSVPTLNS